MIRVELTPAMKVVALALIQDYAPGTRNDRPEMVEAIKKGWLRKKGSPWSAAPGWTYHPVTKKGAMAVAKTISNAIALTTGRKPKCR